VVVVMENREYEAIFGDPDAPYINSLIAQGALATRYYGIRHPSLPNYLALMGGSTFGIASDCTGCHVDGPSLVDQLEAAGISWKGYMEEMPSPCFKGSSSGRYAKKHDPFMYFDGIGGDPSRCRRVVPLSELAHDLSTGSLPRFAWITPDLCHDMHDCDVRTGDAWLSGTLPPVIRALGPDGVLFVTFDEGTTGAGCCRFARGGHIVTIAVGSAVRAGARSARPYDHYSMLKTIEQAWGLPPLKRAACPCTNAMTDLLAAG
jgi:phosphatidylinositol-3-phosphatase